MSFRDRGRGERDNGEKRGDDAMPVDEAVDALQGACDGGRRDGVWTGVVARGGGIYRRGGVTMPSGGATTAAARGEGLVAGDMGAWASDGAEHGSASVAARPERTGECAAEAGGKAVAEEVELAEAEPDRLHGPAIRSLVSRVVTQVVLCM